MMKSSFLKQGILWCTLNAFGCAAAVAGDPSQGPPDWECTYPVRQQTCRQIIDHWVADHESLVPGGTFANANCQHCDAEYVNDYSGERITVGYKCRKREGRAIVAADLDAAIVVYGQAESPNGWRIDRWHLKKCARYWHCAEMCSLTTDSPQCFATRVIAFGRYVPVTGDACNLERGPESSPEAGAEPEADESTSPSGESSEPPRDNNWVPLY